MLNWSLSAILSRFKVASFDYRGMTRYLATLRQPSLSSASALPIGPYYLAISDTKQSVLEKTSSEFNPRYWVAGIPGNLSGYSIGGPTDKLRPFTKSSETNLSLTNAPQKPIFPEFL